LTTVQLAGTGFAHVKLIAVQVKSVCWAFFLI